MVKYILCLALAGLFALTAVPATAANSEIDTLLKQIKLPPGFKITLFGEAIALRPNYAPACATHSQSNPSTNARLPS